jgi:hypothetical protein
VASNVGRVDAGHLDLLRNRGPDVLPGARRPAFHAEHQGQQATFTFDGEILAGSIGSVTARRLIREWALARRAELEANWLRANEGDRLQQIAPLD